MFFNLFDRTHNLYKNITLILIILGLFWPTYLSMPLLLYFSEVNGAYQKCLILDLLDQTITKDKSLKKVCPMPNVHDRIHRGYLYLD